MDTQSKYSKNVREFRRLRAIELFESGMKPIRIAEAVGVTRGAVSQWLKVYREKGKDALRHKKYSKKPCRLSPEQKSELLLCLAQGAEAFGYEGQIWTQARVCALIKMKFGITYTVKYMGQLLRKLRWSWQKPVCRATQRNENEVEQWLNERWPAIKKSP